MVILPIHRLIVEVSTEKQGTGSSLSLPSKHCSISVLRVLGIKTDSWTQ